MVIKNDGWIKEYFRDEIRPRMPKLTEERSVKILEYIEGLSIDELDLIFDNRVFDSRPKDFIAALASEVLRLRERLENIESQIK